MQNKKNIIILAIIIIVILITTGVIVYFTTDLFKSPSKLFWKYIARESENIELLLDDKKAMQNEFRKNSTYTSNGDLSLILKQGENSSKQLNIVTTARHDVNSGRIYADATLKNGDLNIFSVSYINSGNIYAIKCDDVTPVYVGIKNEGLQKLASDYKIPNSGLVPNSISIEKIIENIKLSDEQKKYIKDTYFPIIINNISESQYSKGKEQILVNDSEYHETDVYSIHLTGENIKQTLAEILNNLKSDDKILGWISNVASKIGLGADYTDITNLKAKIQELVDAIQSSEFNRDLNIYLYRSGREIIKTKIELLEFLTVEIDNRENKQSILIEKSNSNENNIENDTQDSDESNIIDLNGYADNEEKSNTRITISRENDENKNINVIEIIPDTQKEEKITMEIQRSNIQNNSFNNSCNIVIQNKENNSVTISYNSNTTKTNEVEEIMELTDSNSAIANNYDAKQFKTFITSWCDIFVDKFSAKLGTLGFEGID